MNNLDIYIIYSDYIMHSINRVLYYFGRYMEQTSTDTGKERYDNGLLKGQEVSLRAVHAIMNVTPDCILHVMELEWPFELL
jgi:hypothetical protein